MTDTARKDCQIPTPKYIAINIGGQPYMMPYIKVMEAIDKGLLAINDAETRIDITPKDWCFVIGMVME